MSTRPLLLLTASITVASVLVPTAVQAQEPPPDPPAPAGAVDGIPVGSPEAMASTDSETEAAGTAGTAATTQAPDRYFGSGPYDAIVDAVAATTRCSALTESALRWMVLAPIFGESSGATSPSTAPAPMTLSRFDEWSGTWGTGSNADGNSELYAGANPATAYKRVFWHPGIGIWQHDSAGVGALFTAAQRMDTRITAGDVAAGMRDRFCAASGTNPQRRQEAWRPWWAGDGSCTECETVLQQLATEPERFHPDVPMSSTGGLQTRTCSIDGQSATFTCWYVDPAKAQGATWWATLTPLDGGSPTVTPTPIAYPFYVFERNGYEERHWLPADSSTPVGYAVAIWGHRLIGQNARNRGGSTGLDWVKSATPVLCDRTLNRGACDPIPPSGTTLSFPTIGGIYRPLVGRFETDADTDVFWYAPGPDQDYLALSDGDGTFSSQAQTVNGLFSPVVGDFDANGVDDIFWYAPGSGQDYLWLRKQAGGWVSVPVDVAGQPVVRSGRFTASRDALFAWGRGSEGDFVYVWSGGQLAALPIGPINGTGYQPVVADTDGNGLDDVLLYAPGPAGDYQFVATGDAEFVVEPRLINGSYQVVPADLDGDGSDDLVLHSAGPATDYLWFGGSGGLSDSLAVSSSGSYVPYAADLDDDGRDEVHLVASGPAPDFLWNIAGRTLTSTALPIHGSYVTLVGAFGAGTADDVLWYGPGPATDALWLR